MSDFPSSANWKPIREALHAYCRVLGGIREQLTKPHPRWWHGSLQVVSDGLTTGPLALGTGSAEISLNLQSNEAVVSSASGQDERISLRSGLTGAALAEFCIAALEPFGQTDDFADARFDDATQQKWDPEAARRFLTALRSAKTAFEKTRAEVCGDCSPVQLWPHHLDLSFEWFGAQLPTSDSDGSGEEGRSQIGFGFSPGDDGHEEPYFYANPWPFDEDLTEHSLPAGAQWHLEAWKGSLLPYAEVRSSDEGLLLDYFAAVFAAA